MHRKQLTEKPELSVLQELLEVTEAKLGFIVFVSLTGHKFQPNILMENETLLQTLAILPCTRRASGKSCS